MLAIELERPVNRTRHSLGIMKINNHGPTGTGWVKSLVTPL